MRIILHVFRLVRIRVGRKMHKGFDGFLRPQRFVKRFAHGVQINNRYAFFLPGLPHGFGIIAVRIGDLAVRIDGKSYFVDGTDIDSHGDAHAKDGFCNAIRKAEVQGEIVNDRFKVTYFKLLKQEKKNDQPASQKN